MRDVLYEWLTITATLFLLRLSAAFFLVDRSPDSLSSLQTWFISPDRLSYLQAAGWGDFIWTTLLWNLLIGFLTALLLQGVGFLTSGAREDAR